MYVKYIFYIMHIYIHTHLLCNMYAGKCKVCQKVGKEDKSCKYPFFFLKILLVARTKDCKPNEQEQLQLCGRLSGVLDQMTSGTTHISGEGRKYLLVPCRCPLERVGFSGALLYREQGTVLR